MKYLIIPRNNVAMEINADIMNCNNKADAMVIFAINMDSDMGNYFQVVTEKEYAQMLKEDQLMAYRKQELEFRIQDAKNHVEDLYEGKVTLTEEEYKEIAKEFLCRYDCNQDENSLFEWIIEGYVDKEGEHN